MNVLRWADIAGRSSNAGCLKSVLMQQCEKESDGIASC